MIKDKKIVEVIKFKVILIAFFIKLGVKMDYKELLLIK